VQLDKSVIRAALALGLNENLPDLVVDGVLIKDIHGRLDLDFDNYGPELVEEPQSIDLGLLAWHTKDQIEEQQAFMRKRVHAMASLDAGGATGIDDGSESDTSVISVDRCRESPYYPFCEASCWLKTLHSSGAEEFLDTSELAEVPSFAHDVYQDLQPGFTRVLILEPGDINAEIFCTLEHINISDPGLNYGFEALSYSWGDPTPNHIIICNGQTVGITSNLFGALRYLRLEDSSRTLWIDAICINQSDVEERNRQIRYMYDIYNRATRVVVWLGVDGQNSELAVQAARYLRSRENRHLVIRHDHEMQCLQSLEEVIESLEALLQRPWFRRSWIRQEIAAARRVVVKCGHGQITWTELKRAANCRWRLREKLLNNANKALSFTPPIRNKEGRDDTTLRYLKRKVIVGQSLESAVADIRSLWYYHTGGLLEYLMTGRAFDATDARDKVYSVLGMTGTPVEAGQSPAKMIASLSIGGTRDQALGTAAEEPDEERRSSSSSPAIRVDYSATVSEVYQQVAKYLINATRVLDILIIISTHRSPTGSSDDLPSWCPDWRVPTSEIALGENYEYFHYKIGAAGFTKCLPQDQNDIGRLTVQGFRLDVVTELMDVGVLRIPHPPEEPTGSLEVPFKPGTHTKCLCKTGEYIGFFPRETRVGDEVWILYGCKMPMVLAAAREGTHVVVGPSYLPTMMWGKGLKEFLESGDEIDTIVLV
jgi:hypothetical protein